VRARRQTTVRANRAIASEHELSKSIELERRLARLEIDVRGLHAMLQATLARLGALEAQLDRVIAKQLF